MKNVFIWAAMLSLLTVSCGSEKAGNSVDVEDAAEALYVVQNEINGLSSSAGIGYLVYADADHQTRVDCDTAGVPQTGIRRHVFYKHKWHFSIGETNETPFVFSGRLTVMVLMSGKTLIFTAFCANSTKASAGWRKITVGRISAVTVLFFRLSGRKTESVFR